MQESILEMFDDLLKSPLLDRIDILKVYYKKLKKLSSDKYSKRAFLYLDILIWLESKISKLSITDLRQIESKIK